MSDIQDEAYSEAMNEIQRLKWLNAEERATIDQLAQLCLRAADALAGATMLIRTQGERKLIDELRKAAE